MVPGLELTGIVDAVGEEVVYRGVGQVVGVGRVIDSCRDCQMCNNGQEQYCEKKPTYIYNCQNAFNHSNEQGFPTFGGASQYIVVNERYTYTFPNVNVNLAGITPMLHTGMLVYSPMKNFDLKSNHKVGIIGLEGIGHIAVKFAVALGANVTVFETVKSKKTSALYELKADSFVCINDEELDEVKDTFDFILDTRFDISDLNKFVNLLKVNGELSVINMSKEEINKTVEGLNLGTKIVKKSVLGGKKQIQDMINLCCHNEIYCDIELIYAYQINEAIQRTKESDIKYIFVLDITTIDKEKQGHESFDDIIGNAINKMEDDNREELTEQPTNTSLYVLDEDSSEVESDSE